MKKIRLLAVLVSVSLLFMAGCGSDDAPAASSAPAQSAPQSEAAEPAAESEAPAASEPAAASEAPSEAAPAAEAADVAGIAATLAEAASLGTTIDVAEIDVKANGLPTDNLVAFAGLESNVASENGGTVLVFQVQPGTAGELVSALESYRDARAGDDRYAEYATARDNTAGARIKESGDLVMYAVSATGHEGGWDALDAALAAF